jgi:hypothetical protein
MRNRLYDFRSEDICEVLLSPLPNGKMAGTIAKVLKSIDAFIEARYAENLSFLGKIIAENRCS